MIDLNRIYHNDVLDYIDMLPDEFVQCITTSPPYYALRSYGIPPTMWPEVKYRLFGFEITVPAMECCLGLEPSPEAFIGHIVLIFRRARRVLKDDGVLFVNMGDSYWGGKGKSGQSYSSEAQQKRHDEGKSISRGEHQIAGKGQTRPLDGKHPHIKSKDLVGIPWMMAFALREDGWYLRQDNIWSKPNPMPESVKDRNTKAHEYIFHLTKSPKYYWDAMAIATPYAEKTYTTFGAKARGGYGDGTGLIASENWHKSAIERKPKDWGKNGRNPRPGVDTNGGNQASQNGIPDKRGYKRDKDTPNITGNKMGRDDVGKGNLYREEGFANKKSVWTVATRSFPDAHFAVYPPELIIDCIKVASRPGDIVCDLFTGSGTTAVVARKLDRNFTGCDLNNTYIEEIANPRLRRELGLFL